MSKNIPETPDIISDYAEHLSYDHNYRILLDEKTVIAELPKRNDPEGKPIEHSEADETLGRLLAASADVYVSLAGLARELAAVRSPLLDKHRVLEALRLVVPPKMYRVELTETREYTYEIEVEADDEREASIKAEKIADDMDQSEGYEVDGDDYSDRNINVENVDEVES